MHERAASLQQLPLRGENRARGHVSQGGGRRLAVSPAGAEAVGRIRKLLGSC